MPNEAARPSDEDVLLQMSQPDDLRPDIMLYLALERTFETSSF